MVLGARQLVEYLQQGLDQVVNQVEAGEKSGLAGALVRLHDALHRRHGHDIPSGDVVGEL